MVCALASGVADPNAKTASATSAVAGGTAGTVTTAVFDAVAGPGPEPGAVAVGSCAVLGIVAHAVSVRIHKRAATLGGPVTGGLRGPCGAAAQRVACALQPCGTRVSPRAIYPGVIRETPPRIQAAGRRGRRGASPSARSLTGTRSAGRGYRNCRSKGHCGYQGDCRHARAVILVPSFHLVPLSTCLGRRLVLRGAFVPFTLNTSQGGISLHVI